MEGLSEGGRKVSVGSPVAWHPSALVIGTALWNSVGKPLRGYGKPLLNHYRGRTIQAFSDKKAIPETALQ
jgi:hypothetical protein